MISKFKFNGCRAWSQAIMYCKMQSSHTRNTWACSFNPNSVATLTRSPAIIQLRDALLSYAKHIDHCALNPNAVANRTRSLKQSCIVRCNPLIRETHEPFLSIPSQ
jgi:hypothetical protein